MSERDDYNQQYVVLHGVELLLDELATRVA